MNTMSLPTPHGFAPNTSAPGETSSEEEDDKKTVANAIKQFGPSVDSEDNPIPVPTCQGVDFAEIVVKVYSSIASILAEKGVTDVESFIEEAEGIDKGTFPGNKHGRVSYNTIRGIANICKQYALQTKQRGAGGMASMKSKLAEKDTQLAALQKKMEELLKQLGMSA